VLTFLQVFRDFGLTNALLRKGRIDEEEINFLFWFNLGATVTMCVVVAAAAPFIAAFYHEPIIAATLWVSLWAFMVSGAALQFNAVLKRELRFGVVAGAETAGALVALVTGIVLAYLLRNVWALVAMNMAQSLTQAAVYFFSCDWRPGRPRQIANMRELLRFGANSSIFTMLNFISRNAGTFVIGRTFGSTSLGFYNRANALYQLPLSNLLEPLAQAALPVMARLRQTPDLYRQTYLGLVEKLCCVLMPSAAFVLVGAESIVLTLLGPQWAFSAVVLRALAPSLAIYGLFWPTSDLLISQNRSGDLRTSGIYDVTLRAGGVLVGAQFGFISAAAGLAIGTIATVPIRVGQAGRSGPISAGDQYRAFLPSIPLGIAVLVAGYGAGIAAEMLTLSPGATFLTQALAATLAAVLSATIVPSTRRVFIDVLMTLTGRYSPTRTRAE
jgi:PST family polysaccharide transporter